MKCSPGKYEDQGLIPSKHDCYCCCFRDMPTIPGIQRQRVLGPAGQPAGLAIQVPVQILPQKLKRVTEGDTRWQPLTSTHTHLHRHPPHTPIHTNRVAVEVIKAPFHGEALSQRKNSGRPMYSPPNEALWEPWIPNQNSNQTLQLHLNMQPRPGQPSQTLQALC